MKQPSPAKQPEPKCGFCGALKSANPELLFFKGNDAYICVECSREALHYLRDWKREDSIEAAREYCEGE